MKAASTDFTFYFSIFVEVNTRQELVKCKHSLGIVLGSNNHRSVSNSSNTTNSANSTTIKHITTTYSILLYNNHKQSLDVLQAQSRSHSWICIPMFNLSTFLREWHALLTMKYIQAMPLASYLLKGSPVIPAGRLR
jgi:hypothetical protein